MKRIMKRIKEKNEKIMKRIMKIMYPLKIIIFHNSKNKMTNNDILIC
jgi:hypothetical protein